jgi:hypothetical protein
MQVNTRWIQLSGNHTVDNPYFSRCVFLNQHCIELREYASGAEECLVNDTVYAADTVEMIRADGCSVKASEAFAELTGFWPADWDRTYRRKYWSEWMDVRKTWWLDFRPADDRQYLALIMKYWQI